MQESQLKPLLKAAALAHPQAIMYPFDNIIKQKGADGFETVYALADEIAGLTFYMPSTRRIFAECLHIELTQEFNGSNYTNLSKKYGFSERHIRRIVGQK